MTEPTSTPCELREWINRALTAEAERDALARAILPDDTTRASWTIHSLVALAEAHRSDSEFRDGCDQEGR